MTFANHLKNWLEQSGYSNYRAAKILEVDSKTIALWLAGKACPHQKAFMALMKAHTIAGASAGKQNRNF